MATTIVSTKGQVIIPKLIRERRGWHAGTELELVEQGDSILLRVHGDVPPTTVEQVVGCLPYREPAKTIAEMDAAVARLARRQRKA